MLGFLGRLFGRTIERLKLQKALNLCLLLADPHQTESFTSKGPMGQDFGQREGTAPARISHGRPQCYGGRGFFIMIPSVMLCNCDMMSCRFNKRS